MMGRRGGKPGVAARGGRARSGRGLRRREQPLALGHHSGEEEDALPALERAFDAGARRLLDGFVGLSMATAPVASALTVNWNTPEDIEAGREGAA